MQFTAYDKNTGQILFSGTATAPSELATDAICILAGKSIDAVGWIDEEGGHHLPPESPNENFIFDYTTKQWIDPRTPETEWPLVRAERDRRLAATDWTQLPDVPLATKEAWANYRQALRDVTLQPDPFNIVWPTAPQ